MHDRPLVLALAVAAALAAAPGLAGANPATVQVHAYDSRGVDTGNCLSTNSSDSGPQTFILSRCDRSNPYEAFSFDPNGQGGHLSSSGPGYGGCLGVTTAASLPSGGWKAGAAVVIVNCATASGTALNWRWNNQQIIATQSPQQHSCLTFVQSLGPAARIGDCAQPTTLTHWDIQANPCFGKPTCWTAPPPPRQ